MKLSRREREKLSQAIQAENEMLKKVTGVIRNSVIVLFVCLLFVFWGFTGMRDAFLPNIPDAVRTIVKWAALLGAVLAGIMIIFAFVARHNGRKHLLSQIDLYQGK